MEQKFIVLCKIILRCKLSLVFQNMRRFAICTQRHNVVVLQWHDESWILL